MPKPYITSLEDLFDPEGGDMPKLVENNMTNKPMGPKSFYIYFHSYTVNLIRLPSLQISYKGNTNAHVHIRGHEL